MRGMGVDTVIVVDVEAKDDLGWSSLTPYDGGLSGWRLLWDRWCPIPSWRTQLKLPRYAQIVNQLTWMTHAHNLKRVNEDYRIDLYLRPPNIGSFKLMDFHLMERIVKDAYRYAGLCLKNWSALHQVAALHAQHAGSTPSASAAQQPTYGPTAGGGGGVNPSQQDKQYFAAVGGASNRQHSNQQQEKQQQYGGSSMATVYNSVASAISQGASSFQAATSQQGLMMGFLSAQSNVGNAGGSDSRQHPKHHSQQYMPQHLHAARSSIGEPPVQLYHSSVLTIPEATEHPPAVLNQP